MKMRTRYKTLSPPGEHASVYGYAGVVADDGHIYVDVPESMAAVELECGRMSSTVEDDASQVDDDTNKRGGKPKA